MGLEHLFYCPWGTLLGSIMLCDLTLIHIAQYSYWTFVTRFIIAAAFDAEHRLYASNVRQLIAIALVSVLGFPIVDNVRNFLCWSFLLNPNFWFNCKGYTDLTVKWNGWGGGPITLLVTLLIFGEISNIPSGASFAHPILSEAFFVDSWPPRYLRCHE